MAAQFELIPPTQDFQSTAEPLIIQVSETGAGPFFKYRFILVIKDRAGNQLAKLKTHPLSSTNMSAIFDISRVLDDYIGPSIANSNATSGSLVTLGLAGFAPSFVISKCVDSYVARKFELELGHEEATSDTADPTETLNEADTTLFAFRDEFINDGQAWARGNGEYQPATTTDNFLSVAPDLGFKNSTFNLSGCKEHRIGLDQSYVLGWGAEPGNSKTSPLYVHVRGFYANGTAFSAATIAIDTAGGDSTPDDDSEAVQFLGAGPANLSNYAAETSNTNLAAIFSDANLAFYEVYLSISTSQSVIYQDCVIHRFTIDDGCSKYPRVQLLFLNRHGGWDAFNFDQKSEERLVGIERSSYNRPRGNWDSVTGLIDFSYDGWERGVTTTTVKAEKQITVSSDYVDEGFSDMLRDIATSRSVYIVEGTTIIPVVVTDSEFLFKTSVNEKLISYSFTLRYSNRPRLK